MKLKCHHFIVLTFVVQQLLLLDDLSLEAFFSLYTTTRHTEAQDLQLMLRLTTTHPFLSAQLCDSWHPVNAAVSQPCLE